MRRKIVLAVERFADLLGVPALLRRARRGQTLVLAFHNVLPYGTPHAGERALHVPQADFEAFLDELLATHDVVGLGALETPPRHCARPRVALTFDDAYTGSVDVALPACAARGMPSTLFVAPGLLSLPFPWWDALAGPDGTVDPDARQRALREVDGDRARVLSLFGIHEPGLHPPYGITDEAGLARVARLQGVTLAVHGWSHRILTRLPDDDLKWELEAPLGWLRERFDGIPAWIAYPYGAADSRVFAAAAEAGYVLGFRADYGWLGAATAAPLDLLRCTISSGTSLRRFRLRVAGLAPRASPDEDVDELGYVASATLAPPPPGTDSFR